MRVKLTAIDTVLTKEAEQRLDEQEMEQHLDYESLGINPPKESQIGLSEEDYEEVFSECEVELDRMVTAVNNIDVGSTIYLDHGIRITVKETLKEINAKRKNFFQRLLGL